MPCFSVKAAVLHFNSVAFSIQGFKKTFCDHLYSSKASIQDNMKGKAEYNLGCKVEGSDFCIKVGKNTILHNGPPTSISCAA